MYVFLASSIVPPGAMIHFPHFIVSHSFCWFCSCSGDLYVHVCKWRIKLFVVGVYHGFLAPVLTVSCFSSRIFHLLLSWLSPLIKWKRDANRLMIHEQAATDKERSLCHRVEGHLCMWETVSILIEHLILNIKVVIMVLVQGQILYWSVCTGGRGCLQSSCIFCL